MKINPKTMTIVLVAMCLALIGASCINSNDPVEFWKPYLVKKYSYHSDKYEGNSYDHIRDAYLEKRFNSMIQEPNEYQSAYLILAKELCDNLDLSNADELRPRAERFIQDRYVNNQSYYGRDLSNEIIANIKSHPELYVENICKIIGSMTEYRAELSKHITAKKVEKESEGGYNRYNVLYSIDDENFVIVCITDKGDGMSEIQFVSNERSINTILDQWSYIING